ncbi:MAG TPA: hypothetical protein VFY29_16370 [Terriglobia bacterium]|nr:hypothetical protein [Terriglobia bacterium]
MNPRSIGIGIVAVLVITAGLWGIWAFESRSAAGTTGAGEFSYPLSADATGPSGDIMLLCAEDFMAEPSQAFGRWLKLEGPPLQIPGGVMMLARLNDVSVDESLKPLQRSTVEILKRYSPRRVVLVAHTNCIYYDTIAAWNNDQATVKQREIADLRAAVQVIRDWFPRAEVSGYLAEENASLRRLDFHPLDKLDQ